MSDPGPTRQPGNHGSPNEREARFPTPDDDDIRQAVFKHVEPRTDEDAGSNHGRPPSRSTSPNAPDTAESDTDRPGSRTQRGEPGTNDEEGVSRHWSDEGASESAPSNNDPSERPRDGDSSVDDSHPYIKITPAREQVVPNQVVKSLFGFHRAGTGHELPLGLAHHLPFVTAATTFEFLIHKPRGTQRFDFYLGVHPYDVRAYKNLANNISAMYPDTFTFEVASFSPRTAFTREHERLAGLRALAELEGIEELEGLQGFQNIGESLDAIDHEPLGDPSVHEGEASSRTTSADSDTGVTDESALEPAAMVRWVGTEAKSNDWMTLLARFSELDLGGDEGYRSPLSVLLEQAAGTDEPFVFQAVFKPRRDWTAAAERHKRDLKMGTHGFGSAFRKELMRTLFGTSEHERREIHRGDTPEQIGGTIKSGEPGNSMQLPRMGHIDVKQPTVTFDLCLRAAGPPDVVGSVVGAFNSLSGPYYGIEGKPLGSDAREFDRLCTASLSSPGVRDRLRKKTPTLVVSPDELANFATVPNTASLPKASRGASGGSPDVRSPLTATDEDLLAEFDTGMSIGHAVTAPPERPNIEIRLTAAQLIHHIFWAASTGSGKSTAIINAILSAYANLTGPVFAFDKKGGAMFDEYKRAHFKRFGTLDDVVHLTIPGPNDEIPAFPFFDIRPQLAAGMSREAAVQEKVDRYGELISYVIGTEANENAFVANEILANLIVALFDPVHGADAYAISDLLGAALRMQNDRELPPVSDPELEATLARHFSADEYRFRTSIDAVMNRITKLRERNFLWRIMNFVPEWDEHTGAYADNQMLFNLDEILASNRIILIDTGGLRPASSNLFTVLLLDYIWSGVRLRQRWSESVPSPDDGYAINLIIDEAAPIMQASLLRDEMIPDAREFALAFGLIVHFPEQVKRDALDTRAYKEILRNIHTKLIGRLALDDELAVTLFHEELDETDLANRIASLPRGEWLAQLPDTGFMTDTPELLTLQPLGIPPGHSESDDPVDGSTRSPETGLPFLEADEQQRAFTRRRYCLVPGINSPHNAAQRAARFGAGVMNSQAIEDDLDTSPPTKASRSSDALGGPASHSHGDNLDGDSATAEATPADDQNVAGERGRSVLGGSGGASGGGRNPGGGSSNDGIWTNEYGTTLGTGGAGPVNPTRPSEDTDETRDTLQGHSRSSSAQQSPGRSTADSEDVRDRADLPESPLTEHPTAADDEGAQPSTLPEDLTEDEARFLRNVISALNGDLEGYDLTESMTKIRNLSGSDIDETKLVEAGYLEHHWAGKKYYWITEKGQEAVDRKLYTGRNQGDLNEKTIHKVFSEYFARYFEYRYGGYTEKYYEPMGGGLVFDVAGFTATDEGEDELSAIGEILTSVNPARVVKHYDDFAAFDGARKYWVVKNYDVAHELVRALETAGRIQNAPWKDVKNYAKITEEAFGPTDEWRVIGANKIVEYVKTYEEDADE